MSNIRKERIKEILLGLALFLMICISFYLYVFWKFEPVYGINDDWTLYMVISGSYLGYPEPHVNYMMYPLACLLSGLYAITSSIPWYGMMLQGFLALCGLFIFFRIYFFFEKGIKRVVVSSLGLIMFLCSHLGVIILIQYTQVGAICAATAIFLFLTADTRGKGCKEYLISNIPTIIMATISLNIRENTLYMAIPIAGMIFMAKWIVEDRRITKEVVGRYAGFFVALLIFLGGTVLIHKAAYSAPEWKEYVEVNNIWTKGVDYYGFPSYGEVEEFLTENGVSEEDYRISLTYQTLYRGEMRYSDYLTIITDVAREKYNMQNPFEVKLKSANDTIKDCMIRDELRPLNLVTILCIISMVLLLVFSKNRNALITFLFYLFGRFFAWYYLLFAGRFPDRIAQGLFSMDIMTIVAIILYFRLWEKVGVLKYRRGQLAVGGVTLLAFALIMFNGIGVLGRVTSYLDIHQDRWYGIKNYCQQRLENRYFMSAGSQTLYYFCDDIFETESIGKKQNLYINTNFDSPSPNFYDMLGAEYESYLGDDMIEQKNTYWIYEKGCFSEEVPIVRFYRNEYPQFYYELVDVFETETSSFEVYQFNK